MNTATATATATATPAAPASRIPVKHRPDFGHLCTKGGRAPGRSEDCRHCLSTRTIHLCGELKSLLGRPFKHSAHTRSAIAMLRPTINRILNNEPSA